jgi:hypothetical protein
MKSLADLGEPLRGLLVLFATAFTLPSDTLPKARRCLHRKSGSGLEQIGPILAPGGSLIKC